MNKKQVNKLIEDLENIIKNIERPPNDVDPRSVEEEAFATGITHGLNVAINNIKEIQNT